MIKFTKSLLLSIIHAGDFSALLVMRISLVFILLHAFKSTDTVAFAIYSTYATIVGFGGVIASYLNGRFLTVRLTWMLGGIIYFVGSILAGYAVGTGTELNLFYFALGAVCFAMGLTKCDSLILTNKYIQQEAPPELQENYSGRLYNLMIVVQFIGFTIAGILMAKNLPQWTLYWNAGVILLVIIMFLKVEHKNIIEDFKTLPIFSFFKKIELTTTVGAIIGICFVVFKFNHIAFIKHVPAMIMVTMVCYLLYLAYQNQEHRKYIYFAILYSLMLNFYLTLEKQFDTIFALFLHRNVDRVFFNYEIPVLNINSCFAVFVFIISAIFFRYKVYNKLSKNGAIAVIMSGSVLSYFTLYIGCCTPNGCMVNLWYYLLALLFMSVSDSLAWPRLFGVARVVPDELKNIVSSYIYVNMGFAFYCSKLYANLLAIDSNVADKVNSLKVYNNGFLGLFIISLATLIILFLLSKTRVNKLINF